MKNFKKIALCFLVFALICSVCLSVACVATTADKEGKITVVIGETEYEVDLSKVNDIKSFDSVLDYLKDTQNVTLKYTTSEFGRYYSQIGNVIPNEESGEFVCIYTSVEKDFGTWDGVSTITYKGKSLTASGLGASSMSIENGCTIVVRTAVYRGGEIDTSGSITLVIGETAYEIDLSKLSIEKGLQSVLDYLKTEKNLTLEYTENNGVRSYTQIGSLTPDREKGEFMRLYTSVAKNALSGENAKTYVYNGVTLTEASVGVTGLSIEKDCVIALILDVLKGNDPVDEDGTVTLVIGETAYTIDISDLTITAGADTLLDYLKATEEITLEYSESEYGRYYSKVGDLSPQGDNDYISVYTSVEKDKGTWDGVKSKTYNGVSLTEVAVGVSSLTIEDDCIIMFVIDTFGETEVETATVVIGETAYTIDISDLTITAGADTLLDYLKATEEITLEYSESEYGRYYFKVGDLSPQGDNDYISVYTSVEKDKGTWDGVKSKTYNGVSLTEVAVGVSSLTIEDDCIIMFVIDTFGETEVDTMTFVIGETAYVIDLSTVDATASADGILDYLNEEKGVALVYTTNSYGRYYTTIGDLVEGNGKYLYFYTSVETDFDNGDYSTEYDYNGLTLKSAKVGSSAMTIEKDCVIAVEYIIYQ